MDLQSYLDEIRGYPPLTRKEEEDAFALAKAGDRAAYEKIMRSNLRFVVSIAKKYQNQGMLLEDLIAEGNHGLIKAYDKFEISKNCKFITYAVWWIRQTIMHSLNENSKLIRLPVNKINGIHKASKLKESLEQQYLREVSTEEVIYLHSPELQEANFYNYSMIEIDYPQTEDDHDLNEVLPSLSYGIDEELDSKDIYMKSLLNKLPEREKQIIKMYYGLGEYTRTYTLTEIGEALDLTRERIRQVKLIALDKFNKNKIKEALTHYANNNEL